LEAAKVGLAIENGRIPASEMAEVLDESSCRWLGVTLDTVNSLAIPEGTREIVRHFARHTLCLHVKDFVVQRAWHMMGFSVEGRPAGEGQMGLPWILEQLKKEGSDPNAILELWPPPQAKLDETIALEHAWAESSVRYLRKHIPN
jgi:sugar phosphate isomerase/epimerase